MRCVKKVTGTILLSVLIAQPVQAFTLKWTDNSDNEDGFNVYRQLPGDAGFLLAASIGPNITMFGDNNKFLGSCYQVTAFNSVGESKPLTACAKAPDEATGLIIFLP